MAPLPPGMAAFRLLRSAMTRQRRFYSKSDGLARRKPSWACLNCTTAYPEKRTACLCGSTRFHYFPSKAELNRFRVLKRRESSGLVANLELQPHFPIVVNGQKIAAYSADFRYTDIHGNTIIEDVKGTETPVFRLKKKLVEAFYGICITVVKR